MIVPSEEDIEHKYHKYIDKVRGKNGKWRYIYSKAKSVVGITQKKNLEQANKDLRSAKNNKNLHRGILLDIRSDNWDKTENGKVMEEKWMESNSAAVSKLQEAKRNQKSAQDEFNKTLLGKIDQVKSAGLKMWDSLFKDSKPVETVTNRGITTKYPSGNSITDKYENKSQYNPDYRKKKK